MNIKLETDKIINIIQNINTKINNFPYNDDIYEEWFGERKYGTESSE